MCKKNERTCRGIKTEKAYKQDWDGTLANIKLTTYNNPTYILSMFFCVLFCVFFFVVKNYE